MPDSSPLGVILVSSGSRGDKLLFRYPFEIEENDERLLKRMRGATLATKFQALAYSGSSPIISVSDWLIAKVMEVDLDVVLKIDTQSNRSGSVPNFGNHQYRNPYALRIAEDLKNFTSDENATDEDPLASFSDKILAHILAVKGDLCDTKFELKIDNVLFVGFPMRIQTTSSGLTSLTSMISINVVFALKASVDKSAISCYQELSQRLAIALCHEEQRCSYLSQQTRLMLQLIEENAALPEDSIENPFKSMLHKYALAQDLKCTFDTVRETGVVQLRVNNWINVSFCLPHITHNIGSLQKGGKIEPEAVQKCLKYLRPFHAMLLLVNEDTIIQTLPVDASPTLIRLLKIASPMKSLQCLAADADLPLSQVFHLVCHLVYWAKATIVYPLCESNVYVLSPGATTYVNSPLVADFVEEFPDLSLPAIMSEFSLPTPLGEHTDVLGLPQEQAQKVQIVVWMLRHRLLLQQHTYVYLMPTNEGLTSRTSLSTAESMKSDEFTVAVQTGFDRLSVSSDDGYSLSSGFSAISKSPSTAEVRSDAVVSEEVRIQHRLQDNLLTYLHDEEKRAIMAVPAANNMDDLKLFTRLCPYFNGNHHLEEIMFYENIRRSQLMTLLDKFRQVLITCTHPDANITYFVKI